MTYLEEREFAAELIDQACSDEKSLAYQILSHRDVQVRIARLICPELQVPDLP